MAHVRGRRKCLVKVDFDFSLVKSEVQVALYRLAYPYDFGVRFTILWAILRPYDCCQFPYDAPFTICVVSVLKIAFCDKKKSLTIFFISTYYFFFKHLTIFNKKGQASLLVILKSHPMLHTYFCHVPFMKMLTSCLWYSFSILKVTFLKSNPFQFKETLISFNVK